MIDERLSPSAIAGFHAICDKWQVPPEERSTLLGGGTQQDRLMRISYMVGIYKALHMLLPDDLSDVWMTRPNDNPLFAGQTQLDYLLHEGAPGFGAVRDMLEPQMDTERNGIPLIPTHLDMPPVTMELVNRLRDEED
jgi:hypothetical protein